VQFQIDIGISENTDTHHPTVMPMEISRKKNLKMKVISLWQPWASLMAWGIKTIETRHWPLPQNIKGPIAIHAAKKLVKVKDPYFEDALLERNLSYNDLPRGFILCYFDTVECILINYRQDGVPDYPERAFGDYTPGRYMWKMKGLNVLPWPLMIQGRQGIWNWNTSEHPIPSNDVAKPEQQLKLF